VNAIGNNHLDGLVDLEVLWPMFWSRYLKAICPAKRLLAGQTGSEMSFVRCEWKFSGQNDTE